MAETKLKTKLTQLRMAIGRTDQILKSEREEAIQRQIKTLKAIIGEVDKNRVEHEAEMIDNGNSEDEINVWNEDIDEKIADGDSAVKRLESWLEHKQRESESERQKRELDYERKLHETKMKMQSDLLHKANAQGTQPQLSATFQAKLPKLVITPFKGTYEDWPRFWGQFKENVDKSEIPSVTKFAYLRELLEAKVLRSVEALPFTAEGYARAISILQEKFGKQSEIVKAYTKQILELPYINNVNVRKIHEFSDQLTYSVQSLQTLGKLDQVNGCVSMTLGKLPGIRGDLVRDDVKWEDWEFPQLVEALRLWSRRHPIEIKHADKPPESNPRKEKPDKLYHAKGGEPAQRGCVYCNDGSHKSLDCPSKEPPLFQLHRNPASSTRVQEQEHLPQMQP